MQYDPIKRSLGNVFNKTPFLRKMFYRLLDLLLLRAWHVHKELKQWQRGAKADAQILVLVKFQATKVDHSSHGCKGRAGGGL